MNQITPIEAGWTTHRRTTQLADRVLAVLGVVLVEQGAAQIFDDVFDQEVLDDLPDTLRHIVVIFLREARRRDHELHSPDTSDDGTALREIRTFDGQEVDRVVGHVVRIHAGLCGSFGLVEGVAGEACRSVELGFIILACMGMEDRGRVRADQHPQHPQSTDSIVCVCVVAPVVHDPVQVVLDIPQDRTLIPSDGLQNPGFCKRYFS